MDPKSNAMSPLESAGFHIDEIQKLRIMDPTSISNADKLEKETVEFTETLETFRKMTDNIIDLTDKVAKQVDQEKVTAIGTRNQLKSVAKAREQEQQRLQALIVEKFLELERLKLEHESLSKIESQQQEFIEQFMLNK